MMPSLYALLGSVANGEPLPLHVEGDLAIGVRVGVVGLVTVEPVKHVEAGGSFAVVTDFYSMAPNWVREGLEPRHNLRFSPQGVIGVNTGRTAVSAALLGTVGVELLTFREAKSVPALDEPAVYGTTELAPVGSVALDLRVIPSEHWGGNLLVAIPLPFTPTGFFNVERAFVGLGVSYRNLR